MPPSATRLTYADFLLIPDDGQRHEIIDGVHYATPCPTTQHQRLVGSLYYELTTYLRRHAGVGEVFFAPFDVVLSNWDVVEPDLLLILDTQKSILTEANVQGPPAIVIEVFCPSTRRRDQTIKRQLFERAGVLEYWMVDPRDRSITVYRRTDGRFAPPTTLWMDAEDALTTPLLPSFSLPLAATFR